jgi:DNA-directed RNA polymerase subunit E'/Rpb7
MKIGDFVFSEYDNGEIVNGEVVNVRGFGDRVLLTVKAEQGYRSIYLDKCITFEYMESVK